MPFRGGMRAIALAALCALAGWSCGGSSFFRQYEYEEEMYLSLDGSATVYVNSSVAALDALRGLSLDTNPSAAVDRDAVRAYFTTPHTQVTWVRTSRRSRRRFVHVRVEVDDVRQLASTAPFAWSSYRFERDGDAFVFRQTVNAAAAKDVGDVGWTGRELVAVRLHLPSKIDYHTRNPFDPDGDNLRRGNILVWEQTLTDRLHGVPLSLDARMQTQSILYRTLWLFIATFAVVAVGFVVVIWLVLRRGSRRPVEQA